MSKCRPHGWRMPAIGDTHLECTICDRKMSYTAEMTTEKYVSIVNAYSRRHGDIAGERFRTALGAAWSAAAAAPRTRPGNP